jgi:hypothetical protein
MSCGSSPRRPSDWGETRYHGNNNLVSGAQQLVLAGGAATSTTESIERTIAEESHSWANPILAAG